MPAPRSSTLEVSNVRWRRVSPIAGCCSSAPTGSRTQVAPTVWTGNCPARRAISFHIDVRVVWMQLLFVALLGLFAQGCRPTTMLWKTDSCSFVHSTAYFDTDIWRRCRIVVLSVQTRTSAEPSGQHGASLLLCAE